MKAVMGQYLCFDPEIKPLVPIEIGVVMGVEIDGGRRTLLSLRVFGPMYIP